MKNNILIFFTVFLSSVAFTGEIKSLELVDGSNSMGWKSAQENEASVSFRTENDNTEMLFHVLVDHKGGEKNYPVGWPRINCNLKKNIQDLSGYACLSFDVYPQTSSKELPEKALGFDVFGKGFKKTIWLNGLKKDKWSAIKLPLCEWPAKSDVTRLQFFIDEKYYTDKT
jgi:hypothetical protein